MNVLDFKKKKQQGEKITLLTCYDFSSAQILEQTTIDCLLVGDSAAMVMHGYPATTHATMDMMVMHTKAVARGIKTKFIVSDLPFLSCRMGLNQTMSHVHQLIQAGAHAVKLEGAEDRETIEYIVKSGVPVMGHLGLTPQSVNSLGGHKVQGRHDEAAQTIKNQALLLENAGCFAIVLECIPATLATQITDELSIPTIGIGAGRGTDGQVLVWQDALGLQSQFTPKFLKRYADLQHSIIDSVNQYALEVRQAIYPSDEYIYANH